MEKLSNCTSVIYNNGHLTEIVIEENIEKSENFYNNRYKPITLDNALKDQRTIELINNGDLFDRY